MCILIANVVNVIWKSIINSTVLNTSLMVIYDLRGKVMLMVESLLPNRLKVA